VCSATLHQQTGVRIYKASFHENEPKKLVFSHTKRAFWACFRENWVYNFGHGTAQNKLASSLTKNVIEIKSAVNSIFCAIFIYNLNLFHYHIFLHNGFLIALLNKTSTWIVEWIKPIFLQLLIKPTFSLHRNSYGYSLKKDLA
jgi:hypothetical protein